MQIGAHLTLVAGAALLCCVSCEKKPLASSAPEQSAAFAQPPSLNLDQLSNRMSEAPTDYLRSFARFSLPYQPWSQEVLQVAEATQKPIFVLVTSSAIPQSIQVAEEFEQSAILTKDVKLNFVPCVVSVEQAPELLAVSQRLSAEIQQAASLPMFIWLSYEGRPIAWLPISEDKVGVIENVYLNSSAMVQDIWKNSATYALNNSRLDNENRHRNIEAVWNHPAGDVPRFWDAGSRQMRQLLSLYNPIDRNFDQEGFFLPTDNVAALALFSQHPKNPQEFREQIREALDESLDHIVYSAIHDPLDGGFFLMRKSRDWSLPTFTKTLDSQVGFANTLFLVAQAMSSEKWVAQAESLLSAIESQMLGKPAYAVVAPPADGQERELFIWSVPELKKRLSAEEYALAESLFDLKDLGNIHREGSLAQRYFRLNSLAYPRVEALAGEGDDGEPSAERLALYRSLVDKLRKIRTDHQQGFVYETTVSADTWAQVVRLYLVASQAGAKPERVEKALHYATNLREDYVGKDGQLLRFARGGEPARAVDYACTILAALDLYRSTLDEQWLKWADELATNSLGQLTKSNGQVLELPRESQVIKIDTSDLLYRYMKGSLAHYHQGLSQLETLRGNPIYPSTRNRLSAVFNKVFWEPNVIESRVVRASLFGEAPLLCVLHGDLESLRGSDLHQLLQSSFYASTVVLAHESHLSQELRSKANPSARVSLLRGGRLIGSADQAADLQALLQQALQE